MATRLQSSTFPRDVPVNSQRKTIPRARGRGVHHASCVLLGMLAVSLPVTAIAVVAATERSSASSGLQAAAEPQRSGVQRSLRDGLTGDSTRVRRGAKAPEAQAASVPLDVPVRDQQSYIEATKRCALAQTKQERENCE